MWRVVEDWIHRLGVEVGFVVLLSPIIYDVVGIMYGRDLNIKVETSGVIIQIIGAILMGASKWLRKIYG